MRSFTEYDDGAPVRYTVRSWADEFMLVTEITGRNDWSDDHTVNSANQFLKEYLDFAPYDWCHTMEVTDAIAL